MLTARNGTEKASSRCSSSCRDEKSLGVQAPVRAAWMGALIRSKQRLAFVQAQNVMLDLA
jgi:hypothetical protein